MLFFGVFLHESARTAAKSRTNLSTHSGKAIKGLGRLAPNLAHMCRFISEWIYAKQIAPRNTRGHMGGFRGSKNQNLGKLSNGWTDWQKSGEAVKRLDRLAPNLAHMCRFIREWIYAKQIALRDTRGGGTWRFYGVKHSKVLESCQTAGPISPTLVHVCGFVWEWT